ncbi:MAG: hypothetical protein ACOC22_02065 [bacterium]
MTIHSKIQAEFEPKRPCRFQVIFPEIMEIQPFYVKELSKLSFNFRTKEYDDLTFSLYDVIGHNLTEKLVTSLVNTRKKIITINIQSLDPVGDIIESFGIIGDLLEVDLGTYSYGLQDELSIIKLIIKPNDILFK